MPRVFTASHFSVSDHHGRILSISRTQPRDMPKKDDLNILFPSAGLLSLYKRGELSWGQYEDYYNNYLRANLFSIRRQIEEMRDEEITLCCWEKEASSCHRRLAAEFLKELGFEVGNIA